MFKQVLVYRGFADVLIISVHRAERKQLQYGKSADKNVIKPDFGNYFKR